MDSGPHKPEKRTPRRLARPHTAPTTPVVTVSGTSPKGYSAGRKKNRKKTSSSDSGVVNDIYLFARESKDVIQSSTGLVYDERMVEHCCTWDTGYPECPERFTVVMDRCQALGLVDKCTSIPSRQATEEEILSLHTHELLNILKSTNKNEDQKYLQNISEQYDGIYVHPSTYALSLLATGSTIELVDAIMSRKVQNGMAVIRPPGHHAMENDFCGYCFFNNIAIAAKHALKTWKLNRILIVDWDVHHGQATQQMFYDDNRVLYFSVHRYEHGIFWPHLRESDFDYIGSGVGKGYNFNIPLNKTNMTNADYMAVFHQVLLPMAYEFQPELILVSSGYDAALGCPEGQMEVTPAFYAHLVTSLMGLAGGKVAVVLEGGYCLKSLGEGAALTLRALQGDPCPMIEALETPCDSIRDSILNVIYSHRANWKCFKFQGQYSVAKPDSKRAAHKPEVKYLSTYKRPAKYLISGDYPVQATEEKKLFDDRLNKLLLVTNLSVPQHRVCLVYDETMQKHKSFTDPSHPECPDRVDRIFVMLCEYGLVNRCHRLPSRIATTEELRLLHTEDHISLMEKSSHMKLKDLSKLQNSFKSIYFHPETYNCALLSAGCTLQVVDSVLSGESRSGVAVVRPPGHHAEVDEPCGFCFFNNVALAAKYAIDVHGLKRVLVVDWDVHHGNGTQHMFESDPRVLYMSLHRYDYGTFFPCSVEANYSVVGKQAGEGYNVNIPWNKRYMGDSEYLAAFLQVVMPIAYQYNPELVLVSAGFDAAWGDPLGGCKVTPEAYGQMTHMLSTLANGKVIVVLEGGYNLLSISFSMAMCTKALLGDPLPRVECRAPPNGSAVESIRNVVRVHRKYWPCLKFHVDLPEENVLPDIVSEKLAGAVSDMTLDDGETVLMKPETEGASGDTITLSVSISDFLQTDDDSNFYAIVPKTWCPHLESVRQIVDETVDVSACCDECGQTGENWLCLICFTVHCSRYMNKHMLSHSEETGHQLALSYADLSVWCYACNSYIDNKVLYPVRNSAHISKFGEDMPWSYGS